MQKVVLLSAAILIAACARETSSPGSQSSTAPAKAKSVTVAKIDAPPLPVGAGAGEPFLASSGETLVASWLERSDDGMAALKFARLENVGWSRPVTVSSGDDFFVNWADIPSVTPLGGDRMIAHWLEKSGAGTYSYDVKLATSNDGGRTWKPIGSPHATEVDSEYGFVSIEPDGAAGAWITWLDGRGMTSGSHGHGGTMTARVARITGDDRIVDESLLDERTCECCQTGMTMVNGAPVVVWRDRSEEEVRDNVISRRSADGSWSTPVKLQDDGWKIPGCPVNGPQIAADGNRIAAASFTAAGDHPRVNVVFSDDGGVTLSQPVIVSDAAPLGRVDVLAHGDRALVTWIEQAGESASVQAALVGRDGVAQRVELGTTSAARSSGFPRMAMHGGDAWVAWTVPGGSRGESAIALARIDVTEE